MQPFEVGGTSYMYISPKPPTMKKGILSLLLAISSLFAMAQCIPSPTGLNAGLYPENDQVPCVVQNQTFNASFTFQNFDSATVSGIRTRVDSIIIDSIVNLPCGISWSTNFAGNKLDNRESGCIFFNGTSSDPAGLYKLDINIRIKLSILPGLVPFNLEDLGFPVYLRVKASPGAACPPVDTTATATLQTSSCNLGYLNTYFNTVRGRVYVDSDGNGSFNGADYGLAGYKVYADASNHAYTNQDGYYLLYLPAGNYSVAPEANANYALSGGTAQYPFNFSAGGSDYPGNDFGLTVTNAFTNLAVTVNSSFFRPGFLGSYTVSVTNLGTVAASGTASLLFDTLFAVNGTAPTASALTPGYAEWAVNNIKPGQTQRFVLNVTTPIDVNLLGTTVNAFGNIDVTGTDTDLDDNTFELGTIISGAYDPNDKTAYPDVLSQEFVDGNSYIVYRIRFQNTGNDTAFNITVRDTINSPFLDINSIQLLSASNDYKFRIEEGNICIWEFPNILLPDSNVNEPGSHGYIFFRIRVKNAGVTHGTEVLNQAGIYFDFNPVVMTDPSVARADFESGIRDVSTNNYVSISPNPAQNQLVVKHAQWQQGASIVFFDLTGKLMQTMPLTNETTEVSTTSLPNGIYLYQVLGATGIEGMGKIVIAK